MQWVGGSSSCSARELANVEAVKPLFAFKRFSEIQYSFGLMF